jgi:hypothetical protein
MFVKPAEGLKVRDPVRLDHLPPEGREVPDTDLYWARARLVGDVIEVPPEVVEPARKSSRSTPSTDRSTEQ